MSDEWGTPQWLIDSVREIHGGDIYVDPFTSDEFNKRVMASLIGTKEMPLYPGQVRRSDTALINPPYSDPSVCLPWLEALDEWVLVVNSDTATRWFQTAIRKANLICFPAKRMKFYCPKRGGEISGNRYSQAVMYRGTYNWRFEDIMDGVGYVVRGT